MISSEQPPGAAREWGVYPGGWEEDVWTFVQQAWSALELPADVGREEPITWVLYARLWDLVMAPGDKNWWIGQEVRHCNPTGEVIGRMDLVFYAPGPRPRERHYTIECKRLNLATRSARRVSNAQQYVTHGIARFLSGQYSSAMRCAGMLGYIMDGDVGAARTALEKEFQTRAADLAFQGRPTFGSARFLPNPPHGGQTQHRRGDNPFVVHHLLVSVPERTSRRGSEPVG
jgi:hypothetical protein